MQFQLVPRRWLDPRPAPEAADQPIRDAVNIPLLELPQRTHELPLRTAIIPVVGPPAVAEQAVAWLTRNGRRAIVQPTWEYDTQPDPSLIGHLWRPTEFLAEVWSQLRGGDASKPGGSATQGVGDGLDLPCGTGRDAVYLAAQGWHMTAVDVLPDALERARDLAARYARAIEPIVWRVLDLEQATPVFDRRFDLIIGFRYLHRPLFMRFVEWLAPGGNLLYETFTTTHRARHGKPSSDAHVLRPGELRELVGELKIVHFTEAWRGAAHTARVWARKATGP